MIDLLGNYAQDEITGFKGIVVARTEWLHGCVRVALQASSLDKDGNVREETWFDVDRIAILDSAHLKRANVTTGGPQRSVGKRRDPR